MVTDANLLIDEADLAMNNFTAIFDVRKEVARIKGFILSVLAKKVYLLSASYATFHK